MALNREQKRQLKKRGDLDEEGEPAARARTKTRTAPKVPPPKEQRTSTRDFVKEVRGELRKVAWPSRKETFQYSGVVGIALIVLTIVIFLLDLAFQYLVGHLFGIQS